MSFCVWCICLQHAVIILILEIFYHITSQYVHGLAFLSKVLLKSPSDNKQKCSFYIYLHPIIIPIPYFIIKPPHYLFHQCQQTILISGSIDQSTIYTTLLILVKEINTCPSKDQMPLSGLLVLNFHQSINTLRPRQNGGRVAEDTFKRIFLNENVRISLKISLKIVPKGPINNNPALVQIMAWRRPGDKPLSEPTMVSLLTHICITRPQWAKPFHAEFFHFQETE